MSYPTLFVFVEGPDDERFFHNVLAPKFTGYQSIKYINYARKKPVGVAKFLKTIPQIPGADFIFLHDLDEHPCFTSCKQKVCETYGQVLNIQDVILVKPEIESWYLAGISEQITKKMGVKFIRDTEVVNKDKFNHLVPTGFASRTDFMVEILKVFSLEEGMQRNRSLGYFVHKYDLKL